MRKERYINMMYVGDFALRGIMINYDKIAEILKESSETTPCNKNYRCIAMLEGELCPIEQLSSAELFACLDENPLICLHSDSFSNENFCNCPLRIKIYKYLNK
jgi:hypothetical protein